MGYFDGLTDAIFKKDSLNNTLFYPWGVLGSGYIIDLEDKKNQIRELIKKTYIIVLPACIITQALMGYKLSLVLVLGYSIWYFYWVRKITKNLRKTEENLKISEAYKNSAKSHDLVTLIFFELISLGFVAMGILLLQHEKAKLIAYSSIGFFGLCGIAVGYMILTKVKCYKNK